MRVEFSLDEWVGLGRQCSYLPENDMLQLCAKVLSLTLEEPNIVPVQVQSSSSRSHRRGSITPTR